MTTVSVGDESHELALFVVKFPLRDADGAIYGSARSRPTSPSAAARPTSAPSSSIACAGAADGERRPARGRRRARLQQPAVGDPHVRRLRQASSCPTTTPCATTSTRSATRPSARRRSPASCWCSAAARSCTPEVARPRRARARPRAPARPHARASAIALRIDVRRRASCRSSSTARSSSRCSSTSRSTRATRCPTAARCRSRECCRRDGDAAASRITVADDGHRHADAVRERAFEPFFTTKERARAPASASPPSTASSPARRHGGDRLRAGQRHARDDLPAGGRDRAVRAASSRRGAARAAPATARVLVVEDQDPVRRQACRILTAHGYSVTEAAARTRRWRRWGPVDLLVTDVVMPGMSRPRARRARARAAPGLAVVFMSGPHRGRRWCATARAPATSPSCRSRSRARRCCARSSALLAARRRGRSPSPGRPPTRGRARARP